MTFFANPIQTWNAIKNYYEPKNQTIRIGNKEWPISELVEGLKNKIKAQDMPDNIKFGHSILIYLAQGLLLAQQEVNQWADVYQGKVRAAAGISAPPRSSIQSNFRS